MSNQIGGIAIAEATFREIQAKGGMQSYVNRSSKFWKRLKKGTPITTNSRGAYFIAELEPNPSNSSYAEGGRYAFANYPVSKRFRVFYTRYSRARGFTTDEWNAIRSGEVSVITQSMSKITMQESAEMARELERQSWGDGSGILAVATANTGAVVTFGGEAGSYFILNRGRYNWVSTAGVVRVNGGSSPFASTAVSKNPATQQVTFDALPSDFANTDRLVWEGMYQRAIHGVAFHVNNDTGMYQGQSRALHPNLRATIQDAAIATVPQPLTTALLDNLEAQTLYVFGTDEDAVADTDRWTWWLSPCQEQAYTALAGPITRVIKDAQMEVLNLAYKQNGKGISHRHRFEVSECHPDDRIDGLFEDTFAQFVAPGGEPGPLANAKGDYLRDVPGFDANGGGGYMAQYLTYSGFMMDLGCLAAFNNGAVINLSTAGLATKKKANI
jgi:hypothetical protein